MLSNTRNNVTVLKCIQVIYAIVSRTIRLPTCAQVHTYYILPCVDTYVSALSKIRSKIAYLVVVVALNSTCMHVSIIMHLYRTF